MVSYTSKAKKIEEILDMDSSPVGIKFLQDKKKINNYLKDEIDKDNKYRYCQALMKARYGSKVMLDKNNIACPASAAAFGFKPLVEKLKSGEMLYKMGLFDSKEAGSQTMKEIPRLELGNYQAVVLAPLKDWEQEVDVVVVESDTEHIMWLGLASYFDKGGRLEFNSSIFQASCVDSTVVPYKTNNINASFGCFGCREATNMEKGEALIGIPIDKFNKTITNLDKLSQKAIPRARSKAVYKSLEKRL